MTTLETKLAQKNARWFIYSNSSIYYIHKQEYEEWKWDWKGAVLETEKQKFRASLKYEVKNVSILHNVGEK